MQSRLLAVCKEFHLGEQLVHQWTQCPWLYVLPIILGSSSEIQINSRHFSGATTRTNNHLLSVNSYTNISLVLLKVFPPPSVNTDMKSQITFAGSYWLWCLQLAWGSRAHSRWASRFSSWASELHKGMGWAWSEGRYCRKKGGRTTSPDVGILIPSVSQCALGSSSQPQSAQNG